VPVGLEGAVFQAFEWRRRRLRGGGERPEGGDEPRGGRWVLAC
jgi:hypothetical protein